MMAIIGMFRDRIGLIVYSTSMRIVFNIGLQILFFTSLFLFKFLSYDAVLAANIPFVHLFCRIEQFNIGQQYRLCLQIEWHCSRRRQPRGVLGSPERSFSGHRASPFHFYIRQRRSQNRNELYKRNRPYFVLAALPQKPIMADTERGLENRVLPNPRFCFE